MPTIPQLYEILVALCAWGFLSVVTLITITSFIHHRRQRRRQDHH